MEQYYQQHDEREVLCFYYYFSAAQARPLFKQHQTKFYIISFHELCRYIVTLSTPLDMIDTRATLEPSKCHNVSVLNIDDIYEHILKVFSWINSMLIS